MEAAQNSAGSRHERELSNLKILSRLLGHELHAQTGARLTMSREQVIEMQTSLDLFIEAIHEDAGTTLGRDARSSSHLAQPVPARMS